MIRWRVSRAAAHAGCIALAACQAAQPEPPVSSRPGPATAASAAPEGASAPAPPLALAVSDAASDAGVQPAETSTVRVEVSGLHWTRYELWKEPSAVHPRGTIVALAYEGLVPWLVEVDLATAAPSARISMGVAPNSNVEIARGGDQLHAVVQDGGAFVWLTYDASLAERRRVKLAVGGKATVAGFNGFSFEDGRAIVVLDDARAYVFDEKGILLSVRDCRPLAFAMGARASIVHGNDLVVIRNLDGPDFRTSATCGFRSDGRGAVQKAQYDLDALVFDVEGALYLQGRYARVRKLGNDLRPVGPPVADPRPALPAERCRFSGDLYLRDEWAWGTEVILTGSCCGGGPGGLFLCSRRDSTPLPRTGTRATPERDVLP